MGVLRNKQKGVEIVVAVFSRFNLIAATNAALIQPGLDFEHASLCTDSRQFSGGQIFLPLIGPSFNGHDFLTRLPQPAAACFVQQGYPVPPELRNVLLVPDTLLAYQSLAHWHRLRTRTRLIAITGSSGKTTTKQLFDAGFSHLWRTHCTQKNHNNDIGVAQTLLGIQPDTDLTIVEMGMRGRGEIARLTLTAEPDLGVITNIGPCHIEQLGSLEAIAEAKCELAQGVSRDTGAMVVNGDDALLMTTLPRFWSGQTIPFNIAQVKVINANAEDGVSFITEDDIRVQLAIPGRHMIQNALSVLAAARCLGANLQDVADGMGEYRPVDGRWHSQSLPGRPGLQVIQDAYNANPVSMQASLETFFTLPAPHKALILGGMNELGKYSAHYHQALGDWLKSHAPTQLAWVILIGDDCRQTQARMTGMTCPVYWVNDTQAAQQLFTQLSGPFIQSGSLAGVFGDKDGLLVLLKGSRSYRLETLLTTGQAVFGPS